MIWWLLVVAFQVRVEDEVAISSTSILVNWALVRSSTAELFFLRFLFCSSLVTSDIKHWKWAEQCFRGTLDQVSFGARPSCTIKAETMDIDSFVWWRLDLLYPFEVCHFCVIDHIIQGPFLGLMFPRYFLFHRCQATIGIEETSQPEAIWSATIEPSAVLIVSVEQ